MQRQSRLDRRVTDERRDADAGQLLRRQQLGHRDPRRPAQPDQPQRPPDHGRHHRQVVLRQDDAVAGCAPPCVSLRRDVGVVERRGVGDGRRDQAASRAAGPADGSPSAARTRATGSRDPRPLALAERQVEPADAVDQEPGEAHDRGQHVLVVDRHTEALDSARPVAWRDGPYAGVQEPQLLSAVTMARPSGWKAPASEMLIRSWTTPISRPKGWCSRSLEMLRISHRHGRRIAARQARGEQHHHRRQRVAQEGARRPIAAARHRGAAAGPPTPPRSPVRGCGASGGSGVSLARRVLKMALTSLVRPAAISPATA